MREEINKDEFILEETPWIERIFTMNHQTKIVYDGDEGFTNKSPLQHINEVQHTKGEGKQCKSV